MKKIKKHKKNSKYKWLKFYMLGCTLLGVFVGIFESSYPKLRIISDISGNIGNLSLIGIKFIFAFVIHIILHELGHLIFGLLTGYKFVSFRVGSATLVIEDKKFKLKKYNIPGTAGQCLMMPPEIKDGRFPFVIYNLGGVLVNLILVIISGIFFNRLNPPYNMINSFLFLSGIFILITNGIPLKIGGIPNDAYNILTMFKDEDSRMNFYRQLKANGLLTFGMRPRDMDINALGLEKIEDLLNPLNISIKLIEYEIYLDRLEIEKAREVLNSLIPYLPKIVSIYRNEINIERIFLDLLGNRDKAFIDSLYNKSLKNYVTMGKYMISKKRFLVAYELYYNGDRQASLERFQELKALAKKYPVKGEADMSISICQWILDKDED